MIDSLIIPDVEVDSTDVEEYYFQQDGIYTRPEQVKIRHILITARALLEDEQSPYYGKITEEEAEAKAESLAFAIHDEIVNQGADFAKMAAEKSHDMTVDVNQGLIGWVKRRTFEHPFDSVAFALDSGEVSEPYKTDNGWHIIQVEGYFEGGFPPINDSIYSEVYGILFQQGVSRKTGALADSLSYDINLEYNDSVMNSNINKVDDWEWAAVLNEIDTIFAFELKAHEPEYSRLYQVPQTTPEIKREMARAVAIRMRLLQHAREMGIDRAPEVKEVEQKLRRKYARSIIEEDRFDQGWSPSDSTIQAYYEEHKDQFEVKKPYVVQYLITEDSLFADFLRDQADAGYDFRELATKFQSPDDDADIRAVDPGAVGRHNQPGRHR